MSKTILITGASSGFGRTTAETLAGAGHKVFASMRDPEAKNHNYAQELRQQGIVVVELDISSDASVEHAVKEVLADAGHIDVLINNAGIASAGITEAFTADQAKVVFNTNIVGLLRTNRAVLPNMRALRWQIRDGKLARFDMYTDTLLIHRAMHSVPAARGGTL
jgi:NADP-dependent 3-hydroxy acid dehydrogenase YdfG